MGRLKERGRYKLTVFAHLLKELENKADALQVKLAAAKMENEKKRSVSSSCMTR